jgi:apolipoprotein D and lipocalin family protein
MKYASKAGVAALLLAQAVTGCRSAPAAPLPLVPHVDLPRFMGEWYVIANIPTFIEKGAHNAIEAYRLAPNGTIETTFTFNAGSFDGKPKRYTPRGFVLDHSSNAVWGMQFIWPIKSDYRIIYLDPDYSQTIIGREKRDYVWIMARTPRIPEPDLQRHLQFLTDQGYDVSRVLRVPQAAGIRP